MALFGQEYSTIKKGFNPTNIHSYPLRIPESLTGEYGEIFGPVLPSYSLQHPDTVIFAGLHRPKKLSTDYGLEKDYDGDWNRFVEDMDPFVSGKRSKVYHFAECRIASTITDKNRIEHESPPTEKRLHKGCPWD